MVQESIDALQKMKAQTTIVIAHRLSTIRNADKIVVIDKGTVAGFAPLPPMSSWRNRGSTYFFIELFLRVK